MSGIEELAQPRTKRLKQLSDSFMDPFRYLKALNLNHLFLNLIIIKCIIDSIDFNILCNFYCRITMSASELTCDQNDSSEDEEYEPSFHLSFK